MKEDLEDRMVERRLSSHQEIKEKYFKVGVVVFIFNQKGEVLVVRENLANSITGKKTGDFGVICETSKKEESWEETVVRGVKEELGIDVEKEEKLFQIDPQCFFLGECIFIEGILARVVSIYWKGDVDAPLSAIGDAEILVVGWEKPEKLLSYPLRIGVRNVLQSCLDGGLFEEVENVSEGSFLPLSISNLKKIEKTF